MEKLPNTPLKSPVSLHEGLSSLSRGTYFREAPLDVMLGVLTESAARMSGVDRVSIWALTDQQSLLHCIEQFTLSTGGHTTGESLRAENFPVFFQALQMGNCIAADDAYVHPMTSEFAEDYLMRHRVTAMLHAPIFVRGALQGVFCLEQIDTRQDWSTAHRLFAQAVANQVTLALLEHEAEEARRQVQDARHQLQMVLDSASEALLLADGKSGEILDLNSPGENLLARKRAQLLGMHQASVYSPGEQQRLADLIDGLAKGGGAQQLSTEIQRPDGRCIPVELTARSAQFGEGRCLILSVFRPR